MYVAFLVIACLCFTLGLILALVLRHLNGVIGVHLIPLDAQFPVVLFKLLKPTTAVPSEGFP